MKMPAMERAVSLHSDLLALAPLLNTGQAMQGRLASRGRLKTAAVLRPNARLPCQKHFHTS